MRNSIIMVIMTTLAMSTLATSMVKAPTTGTLNILSAYADPDFKIKTWNGEEGGSTTICPGEDARENCEEINDGDKCKN